MPLLNYAQRRAGAIAALLLFFSLIFPSLPTLAAAPTARVSPSSGPIGTGVTVTGSGWIPGRLYSAEWNDGVSHAPLSTALTDASGNLRLSFNVPPYAVVGSAEILVGPADGATDATYAFLEFTVTSGSTPAPAPTPTPVPAPTPKPTPAPTPPPSMPPACPNQIVLSPSSGPVGTKVNASGCGFTSGRKLDVRWDEQNQLLTQVNVGGDGRFTTTFIVPANAAVKAHTVYFVDPTGNVGSFVPATFTVTANTYRLPWEAGALYKVTQGNRIVNGSCVSGCFTHTDKQAYAWDFDLPEGTKVVAARGGIVSIVQSKWTADHCGGTASIKNPPPGYIVSSHIGNEGNYVVVDHGDGTAALYLHLSSTSVQVGAMVKQGTELGRSGKTGMTQCGPHLHFQVQSVAGGWFAQSVPITFSDADVRSKNPDGIPAQGSSYVSDNVALAAVTAASAPLATLDFTGPASEQCFPQTGKCMSGRFADYWTVNGGLAQQGYPITDEFDEVNPTNGRTYRTQYFERARFEYHPENSPPYDVLLGLLGREQLHAKYGTAIPATMPNNPLGSDCTSFAQTGMQVCGVFLQYWRDHGGLAQQGLPLTSLFLETNPTDGKQYPTQYFERARFEYHAENAGTPYVVLLGLLGREQYQAEGSSWRVDSGAPPEDLQGMKRAVDTLIKDHPLPLATDQSLGFEGIQLAGDWAIAFGPVRAKDSGALVGEEGILLILRKQQGQWQAAYPDTSTYLSWLEQLPDTLISTDTKSWFGGSSPQAPLSEPPITNFVKQWVNVDPNTGGIIRIDITRDGDALNFHAFGNCLPECDWGIVRVAYQGVPIAVPYRFWFVEITLTVTLRDDRLIVDSFSHFIDNSGRADYTYHDEFTSR